MSPLRVSLIVIFSALTLVILAPLLANKRQRESRQRIEFLEIGRKISGYIASTTNGAPRDLEGFLSRGVLSRLDWQLIRKYQIVYECPRADAQPGEVILRMRVGTGAEYRFHLNGEVSKARNPAH